MYMWRFDMLSSMAEVEVRTRLESSKESVIILIKSIKSNIKL